MMYLRVLVLSVLVVYQAVASDLMKHTISGQSVCKEVTRSRTRDCRWLSLKRQADQEVVKGDIIAYRIQWFNGGWSGWYIPGHNDIDWKVNINARSCRLSVLKNSLRYVWSYFYDHTHKYIVCQIK